MGWLLEVLRWIGKNIKSWIRIPEELSDVKDEVSNCKTDIKSLSNDVQGTRNIVIRIDEYGSKGAIAAISKIDVKIDKLDGKLQEREDKLHRRINEVDNKLDLAALEVARLKGIVINGKNGKTAKDNEISVDEKVADGRDQG